MVQHLAILQRFSNHVPSHRIQPHQTASLSLALKIALILTNHVQVIKIITWICQARICSTTKHDDKPKTSNVTPAEKTGKDLENKSAESDN